MTEEQFFNYAVKIVFSTDSAYRIAAEELGKELHARFWKTNSLDIVWHNSPIALCKTIPENTLECGRVRCLYESRIDEIPDNDTVGEFAQDWRTILTAFRALDRSALGEFPMPRKEAMINYLSLEYKKKDPVSAITSLLIEISKLCWGFVLTPMSIHFCERPQIFHHDDQYQIGNETGPAIQFRDGTARYMWKNIVVPEKFILKRDQITGKDILKISNTEVRAAVIDLVGAEKVLLLLGGDLIHKDEFGELYELKESFGLRREPTLKMIKVKNSTLEPDSTYCNFFLWVPPDTATAKEGVARTFGLDVNEYMPREET